jgi:ribosomal protein S12 methylthiotransferase
MTTGGGKSVHFVTLGCPKNEVDTDRMAAAVDSSDHTRVASLDDADVVVVNTCGFIKPAVEESIDVILDLAEWRDARAGRKLIVAGCMVSRYGDELAESLTEADAFIPVTEESRLLDHLAGSSSATATRGVAGATRTRPGSSAYLQISDGCFRSCAYCTIPAIRGEYRSMPLEDIAAEAAQLASGGAREIILIGQDISAWGRDLPGPESLPDVIRAVAAAPGAEWLRLMYVQPDGITDELLETMVSVPAVCHYLDMPLQHASAAVLRRMHRTGSAEEFLTLIERIREAMPDVVLRTSLIAGFPGETDDDVDILVGFIERAAIDYVGVFPYSPEPGTPAAELSGLPPERTRLARAQRLRDVADAMAFTRMPRLIGRELRVLAEGMDEDGAPVGRWQGQAPEIDGLVYLDREVEPGTLVTVRVTDTIGYDLEGEIIE